MGYLSLRDIIQFEVWAKLNFRLLPASLDIHQQQSIHPPIRSVIRSFARTFSLAHMQVEAAAAHCNEHLRSVPTLTPT